MGKKVKSGKRKLVQEPPKEDVVELPAKRMSDEPIPKKTKWTNKQRVLVLGARGINFRCRHLMEDIRKLMPHHKKEDKVPPSKSLTIINEMSEMKNCNKSIFFEVRKKTDIYMWFSNCPKGPSAKFLVENVHTMAELKLTGNCLRGSRPLLSFDPVFSEKPQYLLLKELLSQIFGVPNHHPKSQPFFDHIYTFTILDNRIWFRNFQILSEDGALAEIGPRFVLNPVKIFAGSFGGETLWENEKYVSPNKYRQQLRLTSKYKYLDRMEQRVNAERTRPKESYSLTPMDDLFKGDPYEKAKQMDTAQNGKENGVDEEKLVEEKEDEQEEGKVVKKNKVKGKTVGVTVRKVKKPITKAKVKIAGKMKKKLKK